MDRGEQQYQWARRIRREWTMLRTEEVRRLEAYFMLRMLFVGDIGSML